MRLHLLGLITLISLNASAQRTIPEFTQSTSSLEWETISNEFVQVIYPSYLKKESVYVANLIEHYSQYVGKTYEIEKPKSFPLIIRAEMADPNGFVTLAPRRSEWYSSSSYSNYVGSSEWYQTLAIHEYRHVNQYDHANQKTIHALRYLFGDMAQFFSHFSALQSWYFEGDAVWAETKYTDAGRGRSPLFMARLKAVILSEEIPTYDQFVNGTYNTRLPNQYIYGYALISYATQKFGEDFWNKVIDDVAVIPHPRRLYSSFEKVSGQNFMDFYDETMKLLKYEWKADKILNQKAVDYRENIYPFKIDNALYSLRYNMDSFWTLYKDEEKIIEIPFFKEINQIHLNKNLGVYAQQLPNERFGYKGSSDLILIDLKEKKQKKITNGERIYSPRLNQENNKILATEFTTDQKWVLSEFNLSGKKIRSVEFADHLVSEAFPVNSNEAVVILADKAGYKSIRKVDLNTKQFEVLLPETRNNMFALFVDEKKDLYFEAQYQGYVNIFRIDNSKTIAQCTNSKIMANSPSSDGEKIYYSDVDSYGSKIATIDASDCKPISKDALTNFNYIGKGPSDNFNQFPLQKFPEQKDLYTKNAAKYKPKKYNNVTKELFIPHSWGFIGGRGFELSAKTDNYLRTMGMNASVGSSSEENTTFAQASFDYKKYYPVFTFYGEMRNRMVGDFSTDDQLEWKEKIAGIQMTLPYIHRQNLYSSFSALSLGGSYLDTSKYELDNSSLKVNDRYFHESSIQFLTGVSKDLTARSILSPWSANFLFQYNNADSQSSDDFSSYRFYKSASFTTPGLVASHGLKLIFDQENQNVSSNTYRFIPVSTTPSGYVFSRGYVFESTEEYKKVSGNYVFPLLNPDMNLGGWYYLKRVKTNLYFDSTRVETRLKEATYNSYGAELEFESKILRILPLNIGVRYINKMDSHDHLGEVYTDLTTMF